MVYHFNHQIGSKAIMFCYTHRQMLQLQTKLTTSITLLLGSQINYTEMVCKYKTSPKQKFCYMIVMFGRDFLKY